MNQAYLKNILSAKFDFNIWKDLLEKIFPKVEFFTSVAKITVSQVKDGGHVGNIRLDDGRSLAIFHFEVTDNVQISRNRKSLRDIAAKYVDQGLIHGALVFYYSQNQDDYRLTFIAKQTYFNESGELIKKETAPKRYTFLLGSNEPCTTAASRLKELTDKKNYGSIYLTDVTDAFSVERLNKEFFNGISIPRNKELMRIYRDVELVESLGSGIPRILRAYGEDCFKFTDNFIRITLPISVQDGTQLAPSWHPVNP